MFHYARVKERGQNIRAISMLSMVGKIYAEILVDRVHRVTEGLIDDEQGAFRAGRGVCKSDLHNKPNM